MAHPDTSSSKEPKLPPVTAEQQVVLTRIAVQRERLRARRLRRAQQKAVLHAEQGLPPDASVAMRAVVLAKQYPLAIAAVAGLAVVAGPKRLMHWAGVALPLLMRMRAQR